MTEYLPLIILAAGAVFARLIPLANMSVPDGRHCIPIGRFRYCRSHYPLAEFDCHRMYLKQNERFDRAAFFAGFIAPRGVSSSSMNSTGS